MIQTTTTTTKKMDKVVFFCLLHPKHHSTSLRPMTMRFLVVVLFVWYLSTFHRMWIGNWNKKWFQEWKTSSYLVIVSIENDEWIRRRQQQQHSNSVCNFIVSRFFFLTTKFNFFPIVVVVCCCMEFALKFLLLSLLLLLRIFIRLFHVVQHDRHERKKNVDKRKKNQRKKGYKLAMIYDLSKQNQESRMKWNEKDLDFFLETNHFV